MKKFPVIALRPDLYFDKPAYLDEKYIIFSPDIVISKDIINRLKKWNFKELVSDGDISSLSMAENNINSTEMLTVSVKDNIKQQELQSQTLKFYSAMVDFLNKAFYSFQVRQEFDLNLITDRVKELITEVKNNKKYILRLSDLEAVGKNYVVNHSIRTAILSLAIADFLRMPIHKQIDIGIAALFHEIGMIKIPQQLYMSDKKLSPEEKKVINTHTVLGFQILKAGGFPLEICLSVLEHHERIDGSGYPRGLTGEKLSIYGKILAVACSYDASTSKRPYKEEIEGHLGIMDILKTMNTKYDERITKALVFTISIYPIGSHVLLSNNFKGVVVDTNHENPKNPIVKLLANDNWDPFKQINVMDLKENKEVSILRILNREEIFKLKSL